MSIITSTIRKIVKKAINYSIKLKVRNACVHGKTIFTCSCAIYNLQNKTDLITIGDNTCLRGELLIFAHGGSIKIGDYCYIGHGTRIWSAKNIVIGNRVLISHNVNIFDSDTHNINDPVARHNHYKEILLKNHPDVVDLNEKEVIIEDDAFIACQSIILKGVTLGRGAVVTKSVEPFTVVAGNPAKVIRKIEEPQSLRSEAKILDVMTKSK
jgi:acetyltransferase-like isoleucine patch superfamily enzyme